MNASLVCMLAVFSAQPEIDDPITVYKHSTEFAAAIRGETPGYEETQFLQRNRVSPRAGSAVVRGQTPGYDEVPDSGGTPPPTYIVPPGGGSLNPFQPMPLVQDPFLGQPGGFGTRNGQFAFGANGPQPFRFGWTVRQDVGLIPKAETQGNLGNFGVTEFNTELEYTTAMPYGWIFSFTQQYNLRLWEGPHSLTPASIGLPGNVHRFGWDLELATPANSPWSVQLAINPSINSDFNQQLSSEAWNLDGRGIAFYRASPYWMIALGAGYWDRVHDRVIPYAGAVWTPDDRWEWRIVFPKPRVSYFLGAPYGMATWIYVSGEYHVEAYEVVVAPAGGKDQVEIEDWRILLGLRNSNGWVTSFLEGGWIFGRDVEFNVTPGFNISTGFILRGGVQF